MCNIVTEFYLYSIVYIYLINSRLDVTFSVHHHFRIKLYHWPHNTHTSRCNRPFKYPQFKVLLFFNSCGNPKCSLPQWLGADCKVHMNTISFLLYIAFIYILQELSQNSACPTPTIIVNQKGLYFYYSYHFSCNIALYGTSQ